MAKIKSAIKSNLSIALLFINFVCSAQTKTDSIKQYFINAKNEIESMLSGKTPLDYERAVFATENAFYENALDYVDFKYAINFHLENIKIISRKTQEVNNIQTKPNILVSKDSANRNIQNITNNLAIYKYITDTTYYIFDSIRYFHPKFQYSFSDPFATRNWQNSQVTTLLDFEKHYGNCNALTSLFKLFSLRLNSNAILCTAPNHIFIRHANENGTFYNVELASKAFPGTGSIETISYTSDEAARSGIAMRELNLEQSIGLLLINLAKGYEHKINVKSDNFILDCAELCLKYDNLNLNAMLLKAEFLNDKIVQSNTSISQLQNNSDFISYQTQITSLYSLGYREMPIEMKNKLVAALMQDTSYISLSENKTYNPFVNSYKPYNRSYSLSNGLFEEVNTTKPKEQYFNTIFDTKTKRIVGFNKTQTLYNKYDFDPVLFALSIDPLAAKMPYYSPYSAFGNNPIIYVDNDGRENIIYLVYLPSKDPKVNKINAYQVAKEANTNFEKMGLATRVVVVDQSITGKMPFDASKIDTKDAVAVIGQVNDVKDYINKNDKSKSNYHVALDAWKGGVHDPELSENSWGGQDGDKENSKAGGNFIAIDVDGLSSTNNQLNTNENASAAILTMHGAGHNADNKRKLNHQNEGIMVEKIETWDTKKGVGGVIDKGKNSVFIQSIKSRFGTNPAKVNYNGKGTVIK